MQCGSVPDVPLGGVAREGEEHVMHEADAGGGALDVQQHVLDAPALGVAGIGRRLAVGLWVGMGRPAAAPAAVHRLADHHVVQPAPHLGRGHHAGRTGDLDTRDTGGNSGDGQYKDQILTL